MKRFQIIKELGQGAFATVYKCRNRETNEVVAIKKMRSQFKNWEDCIKLREVASLRKFTHPNVVKLKEVIRDNNVLYLVFEYMTGNLLDVMKKNPTLFNENRIRNVIHQLLEGLAYVHKYGYMHRDLKPENILVSGNVVKLADFGLAREIRSRPPYTQYISTRWYRAPEAVLQSTNYNSHIDIWAIGTIMAELYTGQPLFPGTGSNDQIFKQCKILGTHPFNAWKEGRKLASMINLKVTQYQGIPLERIVKRASPEAIRLMKDLLQFDPLKRPTASQALKYPFFTKEGSVKLPTNAPKMDACLSKKTESSKVKKTPQQQDSFSNFISTTKDYSKNEQYGSSYNNCYQQSPSSFGGNFIPFPSSTPENSFSGGYLDSDKPSKHSRSKSSDTPLTPPSFSSQSKTPVPIFTSMQQSSKNDNSLYNFSASIDFNA